MLACFIGAKHLDIVRGPSVVVQCEAACSIIDVINYDTSIIWAHQEINVDAIKQGIGRHLLCFRFSFFS